MSGIIMENCLTLVKSYPTFLYFRNFRIKSVVILNFLAKVFGDFQQGMENKRKVFKRQIQF